MWLKLAVPGIVLVILSLVFFDVAVLSSRFTGINKSTKESEEKQGSNPSPATASPELAAINTLSPSPVSTASPTAGTKSTPKPSLKALTGSITLLEDNTKSQSSPQTGSSTISGTINFIGTAPSGSSIVIAARKTGSNEQYKVVVDSVSAQNNASWSWSGASDGLRYDLFAVLKGKSGSVDIDYASSPSSTVKAPYQGQVFIVDAGYAFSAPTGTASVSCTTRLSDNSWNTTVSFPAVSGAKMYHVQIGTTSGNNDILDTTLNSQTITPNFKDSVNYYFRYAVTSVSYPTPYQYSAFSSSSTISCP